MDLFLRDHMPLYSRARLQTWIRGGRVLANGAPVKSSYLLQGGESGRIINVTFIQLCLDQRSLHVRRYQKTVYRRIGDDVVF